MLYSIAPNAESMIHGLNNLCDFNIIETLEIHLENNLNFSWKLPQDAGNVRPNILLINIATNLEIHKIGIQKDKLKLC